MKMKLTKYQNRLLSNYLFEQVKDIVPVEKIDNRRRILVRQFRKLNKQTGRSALSALRMR